MMSLWEKDRISVKHISEHTRLDSGTLTPILKRLEAKKLLVRKLSQVDERQKTIELTTTGQQLKRQGESIPHDLACKVHIKLNDLLHLKTLCDQLISELDHTSSNTVDKK